MYYVSPSTNSSQILSISIFTQLHVLSLSLTKQNKNTTKVQNAKAKQTKKQVKNAKTSKIIMASVGD